MRPRIGGNATSGAAHKCDIGQCRHGARGALQLPALMAERDAPIGLRIRAADVTLKGLL